MPEKKSNTPNRRQFLTGAAGGALLASAVNPAAVLAAAKENQAPNVADWSRYLGDGVVENPYGVPSEYEAHVVRRTVEWLTATRESSICFTPLQDLHGFITPNGLCFERHHGGVAHVNPDDFQLMVHGMVDKPLIFSLEDLKRFPAENKFHFLECAANSGMEWHGAQLNSVQYTNGMIHCVQYTGVSLRTLLNECGVSSKGKWLHVEGGDSAGMNRSLPMDKALDDCMVAYAMNGEMLRPENGYPLRLVVPGWEGNLWIKWLRRIEVGDQPWHAREETAKYTDLMPTGKARRFTWVMEPKSIITSPSPEKPVLQKGVQNITGLAWSGQGKVKRVDISVDGGKNWRPAKLHGPIMEKCMTRFSYEWDWNGNPALLESRAIDDTGYVQPTIKQLREIRGAESIYHNNSIQTWHVNEKGVVDNVQTR